jgi:sugar phosphate isomerase/epimerase
MDRSFTRRSIIKGALACGASAAFGATFPTDPRARIAVATYPFRAYIIAPGNKEIDPKKKGMDLFQFAKFVRTEFNVRGIEPLSNHFPSKEMSEIHKLKAAFDAAGVFTANIPVDERVNLCSDDQAERDAGNAAYAHWIDIAVVLGSPGVRVWIPKCHDTSDLPKAANALKPTIAYAAKHNIVVNLENDDPILQSAARATTVIELVNSRYLRALPDFGNGLAGGDEQFNADAVKQMFAHASTISHVKDAESIDGVRKTASLPALFAIAKASGFKGYYSLESDSDVDPVIDTKHLIEESVKLI